MIKPLTSEDIVAVAELERKYIECPYSEKVLSEFLDKHDTIAYKFESDGILVGYVSGQTVLDECNVNNVVVDERFRRQGIAQGLMAALICECDRSGVKIVFLEVASDNEAAKALYRKNGFLPLYIRKNYYGSKDAVVMSKKI